MRARRNHLSHPSERQATWEDRAVLFGCVTLVTFFGVFFALIAAGYLGRLIG